MVYDEYRSMQGGLMGGGTEQYRWTKAAALRAFQGLAACGLTAYTGGAGGSRLAGRGAAFAAAELRCVTQYGDQ